MKTIFFFTQEGEWAWLNPINGATPMFYKNWDSGEPSDSDAGEDCVEFLKGNGRAVLKLNWLICTSKNQ